MSESEFKQNEPDLTFEETWDQLEEEWGKVSSLYERIRIQTQHEEQAKRVQPIRVNLKDYSFSRTAPHTTTEQEYQWEQSNLPISGQVMDEAEIQEEVLRP
jgi:hypothetical protein